MEGKRPEPWGGRSGAQGRRGRGPACHLSRPARSAAGRGSAFPGPEIGESPLATSPDGRELWRPWSTTRSRTFAGMTRQSAETARTLRGRAGGSRAASAVCKPRGGHNVIVQSHPSLQRLREGSTESRSQRHNRLPWGACGESSAGLGLERETWFLPLSLRPSRPQL